MGLRTHEKRPLFLLRDLGKPVNTAASYYEMSLTVKPDLSLRSSFPFRVARAKQSARKGASDVPFVRDFQRYTQMEAPNGEVSRRLTRPYQSNVVH